MLAYLYSPWLIVHFVSLMAGVRCATAVSGNKPIWTDIWRSTNLTGPPFWTKIVSEVVRPEWRLQPAPGHLASNSWGRPQQDFITPTWPPSPPSIIISSSSTVERPSRICATTFRRFSTVAWAWWGLNLPSIRRPSRRPAAALPTTTMRQWIRKPATTKSRKTTKKKAPSNRVQRKPRRKTISPTRKKPSLMRNLRRSRWKTRLMRRVRPAAIAAAASATAAPARPAVKATRESCRARWPSTPITSRRLCRPTPPLSSLSPRRVEFPIECLMTVLSVT